jgi:hypothetical protein
MLLEFEDELKKLSKKLVRDNKKRTEHVCDLCQGQECGLCGEKCLKLEPVMLTCSGPCNQRIKRGNMYFITRDGSRLWCQKCYTGLSTVLPPQFSGDPEADLECQSSIELLYKRDLLKRVYEEDIPEPWVQCDCCSSWHHQACAMFNAMAKKDGGDDLCKYRCPLCLLGDEAQHLPAPWVHRARDTFFGSDELEQEAMAHPSPQVATFDVTKVPPPALQAASGSPLNSLSSSVDSLAGYTTKESCDGSDSDSMDADPHPSPRHEPRDEVAWDAASLPQTNMGKFIEVRPTLLLS